ncbi:hypothetical protein AAEH85_21400, partial [Shewanella algae]|uniref:hypothetical protein n=1 Tax=Shewanella algae TaxID=38313 RepID=UPI00313F0A3F
FNDGGLVLWQHANQGINFVCDSASATPTDNGLIFPVDIYTPNYDAGTKRGKMLSAMYFNVDQVNAQLAVRYNDNDYQSGKWSNFRTLDLRFAT